MESEPQDFEFIEQVHNSSIEFHPNPRIEPTCERCFKTWSDKMTIQKVVQNITDEFDLAQKEIEAVWNERPEYITVEAIEDRAELSLVEALTDGQQRSDREQDRLDRNDLEYNHKR